VSEPHLTEPLWRAIAIYRVASLGYAVALVATIDRRDYSRLDWAWAALAVMAIWTAVSTIGYAHPGRRGVPLLTTDLVVSAGLLLSTWVLQFPADRHNGMMPVTATWVAGPVLAWAVRYGWQAGLAAALLLSGGDFLLRGGTARTATVTLDGSVLMVLAGVIVGYLARLAAAVERERQHAIGVEAAELGGLAGQQEAALRALVGGGQAALTEPVLTGEVDVRALLAAEGSEQVTLSAPADVVLMKKEEAVELTSAVRAALANVHRHCGAGVRAWVLVEDEPAVVMVTVRDDGPGIPAGRLAEAAAAGRLGISHAIVGRLRDLGGSATIRSAPGEGTEVELPMPRAR
jgi:glucose-6-phosphate-specific signal transduction histidine kinase